jgi:DeoR/GlpR family transcriptional regulator of sugar metabolism
LSGTDSHFGFERRAAILASLEAEGRVFSAQLADLLGVSMDTVRRDLQELEAAGDLVRVHGGAVRLLRSSPRFADRAGDDDPARLAVADAAAGLFSAGGLLAFGGGTTTLALARRLPHALQATVVTTSPHVALALSGHRRVTVDVVGGRLRGDSLTLTGHDTIDQLRRLRPDACVISGCGVDPVAGVTLRERDEASVARAMVEQSRRVIVLATAAKLASAGAYVVAPAEAVDVLVTDAGPGAVAGFAERGVEVVSTARAEAGSSR